MKFRKKTSNNIIINNDSHNTQNEESSFTLTANQQVNDIDLNSDLHRNQLMRAIPMKRRGTTSRINTSRIEASQKNEEVNELLYSNNLQSIESKYKPIDDNEEEMEMPYEQDRSVIDVKNISPMKLHRIQSTKQRIENVMDKLSQRNVSNEEQEYTLRRINSNPSPYPFQSNLFLDKQIMDDVDDDLFTTRRNSGSTSERKLEKPIRMLNEPKRMDKQNLFNDERIQQPYDERKHLSSDYPSTAGTMGTYNNNSNDYSSDEFNYKDQNDNEDAVDSILKKNKLPTNSSRYEYNDYSNNQNSSSSNNRIQSTSVVPSDTQPSTTSTQKPLNTLISDLLKYLFNLLKNFWNQLIPVLTRFFTKIKYINPYMRSQFRNQQQQLELQQRGLSSGPIESFTAYKNHGVVNHNVLNYLNTDDVLLKRKKKQSSKIDFEQVN
jgi:hypothetical protein